MFLPTVFGENLIDEFDPFREFESPRRDKLFGNRAGRLMKTDVRETDKTFELDIDMPGLRKEDISAELKDGYLTVSAVKSHEEKTQSSEKGRYVRQERWSGSVSRTFFVGENVTEEDVKAKYENGILQVSVPKKDVLPKPEKKMIAIE